MPLVMLLNELKKHSRVRYIQVQCGAEVNEDTTVCLIEVMKTFNAMTAGVKGVITEICVKNAQMVEYGQVLFRVRPSSS